MNMREDDYRMHHFRHRPTVLVSLSQGRYVLRGQQPRSVGENLVDLADGQQLLRDVAKALQPRLIPAIVDEFALKQLNKVRAAMSSGALLDIQDIRMVYKYLIKWITHHYRQVETVVVRQGTIAVHDEVLGTQEVLEILGVVPDDLGDMIKLNPFHVVCVEDVLQRKNISFD